jgi:hypothetical protein
MGFLMQEAQKLIQPLDKTLKTMAIEFAESQVASSLYLLVEYLWFRSSKSTLIWL